ncbi:MAG: molybdopterin-dependent oxidoreductase [Halanaeroarchaeum sp.]
MAGAQRDADVEIPDPIEVVGRRRVVLGEGTIPAFDADSRDVEIVCATGNRYDADWWGVPIVGLLDAADAPEDTTHVVVESADGYRVAVSIVESVDGLLAFRKDGRPIGESNPYTNRFVAPDIEGARDVKGVRRIEFHSLAPADDPDSLENVDPVDDRFAADRDQTQ